MPLFNHRHLRSLAGSTFALGFVAVAFAIAPLPAAQAQLNVQSAVVLDFDVFPGLDPNLGRKAADALAVELQTSTANDPVPSQRVEIVPRARMQQVINDTTALSPPYTDVIQARLAGALGANSIYSGRVINATVADRRFSRVVLEIIKFDAETGDYTTGAVVTQTAEDKLGETDNDLLLDEAINKAVYDALLEIKRRPFPIGTVQIATREYGLMNMGSRNGVAIGQKFALLRDIYRGRDVEDRDIVERIKIGEVMVTRLDVDQATIIATRGGYAGMKIGDKLRRIYIPSTFKQELKGQDKVRQKYETDEEKIARKTAEAAQRAAENRRKEAADATRRKRERYRRDAKKNQDN